MHLDRLFEIVERIGVLPEWHEGSLGRQQTGEQVSVALATELSEQLAAIARAEQRLAQGTDGRSIESGLPIPDERLEAEPLAERTIEEQRRAEAR